MLREALDGPGALIASTSLETHSATPRTLVSALAYYIVAACILFNFVLCFLHTNVVEIGAAHVMAAEAIILGSALLLPFMIKGRRPERLYYLLFALFVTWIVLSLARQTINPKLFRDVAIIPVFILLGQASRDSSFDKRMFSLHIIILGFGLWEALSLNTFVSVFSVADFFAHTRGFDNEDWWVDNGLYISSVRPESRFLFPSLSLHRVSSVFLEPVSLGNYVIIATIWLATSWQRMPSWMRWSAALVTLLLLVGCDSRMATMACLVIIAAAGLRRWIPPYAAVPTVPIVIALMFAAVALLGLEKGVDDFGGRIAYSVSVMRGFEAADYFGISLAKMREVEDAGFAYLIMSQSIIMFALLWVVVFVKRLRTTRACFVHFAVAIYLTLNLTVSWGVFSIKTAALLWFLLGKSNGEDADAEASAATDPGASDRGLASSEGHRTQKGIWAGQGWNQLRVRWPPQ